MLLGSFVFASMGTLAHAVARRCDWQLGAFFRGFLVLVFALVLAWLAGTRLVFWRPRILWARSIAGSISMICSFYAFARLPTSDVMTLTNIFPIWVVLLSWPLYRQVPTLPVWLAVVSGIVGVVLIQQPHFAEGNFATLVALAGSVSTAVAMLGLHQLEGLDPRAIVVHFSAVSTCFAVASWFLFDRDGTLANDLDSVTLLQLGGIGVLATVGQLFLTKAFAAGPPAKVSVVALTQIVFAMAFDRHLFDRHFDWPTLLGIGLVLAPTAWLLVQPKKRPA